MLVSCDSRTENFCLYIMSCICINVAAIISIEMYAIGILLILSLFWVLINLVTKIIIYLVIIIRIIVLEIKHKTR